MPVRTMRQIFHRLPAAGLCAAAFALVAPAPEAAAEPFRRGWRGHDQAVVYRPVVTPRTYYFQPVGEARTAPPAARHVQRRHQRSPR